LSLPLRETAYSGEPVVAVFDNLLPDNPHVRRRVAERMGAQGTDYFSLLEAIGRDCVGAMQFLPDSMPPDSEPYVKGEPVSDEEIEGILAGLATAPLGVDKEQDFRVSIAGAQERRRSCTMKANGCAPSGPLNHSSSQTTARRNPDRFRSDRHGRERR
jgi:serine/threonine-protein kinase HipA